MLMPATPFESYRSPAKCGGRGLHRGFSLVELLVVIAIIAILIGILLPAIQRVRESARRIHCANSMRQMGLALHQFESVYQVFPASGWTQSGPGNPLGTYLSWRPLILPYLEQAQLSQQYDTGLDWWIGSNRELAYFEIPAFLCPSTPWTEPVTVAIAKPPRPEIVFERPIGRLDYEAIMGVKSDEINLHLEIPYYNQSNRFSVLHRNSRNGFKDIPDGSSQTIMVVECSGRPTVFRNHTARPDISNDQGQGWADSEGPFSLDGSNQEGSVEGGGPALGASYSMNRRNDNEPYSFHPQGGNFLFADGHVNFIDESISIITFSKLITRAGGEFIGSDEF